MKRSASQRRRLPLTVERLEDRRLLTTLDGFGVAIIDYTDDEFSAVGNWLDGALGDYLASALGHGGNVARWDLELPVGVYDVSATWVEYSNRATDAPFVITDDLGNEETILIDQFDAPDDFEDDGRFWESFGKFTVTDESLIVELSNDANNYVIAEALRVELQDIESPEMHVQVFGQDVNPPASFDGVENGGSIDYGQVDLNEARTASIVVTNVASDGIDDLELGQPLIADPLTAAGSGFTVVQQFDRTTLEPGESTTAIVEFNAAEVGQFDSEVSFTNNFDSPFVLDLAGSATPFSQVIDIFDDDFETEGRWTNGAFGPYRASAAGNGSSVARWEFEVPIGVYQVSATWVEHPNRATDAPFTVLDDGFQLDTVFVDQQLAPDDFTDDGTPWESLGEFVVTGGQLVVELSDDANGYVIADAIRLEQLVLTSPQMYVQVLGEEVVNGGTVDFGDAVLDIPVTRTFKVSNVASAGSEALELEDVDLDDDFGSDFTIVQDFTQTQLDPGESTTLVVEMEANVHGSAAAGLSFDNNDDSPFQVTLTGEVDNIVEIADVLSDNFDTLGKWTDGAFGVYVASAAGGGGNIASWEFDVPDGEYNVAVTWIEYQNRATNAPFSVLNGNQLLDTIFVNQQLAPSDFQDAGYVWDSLGEFSIDSGTLKVELSNDADGYVIADAVRIEQVSDQL
jgi:hypothetical protein